MYTGVLYFERIFVLNVRSHQEKAQHPGINCFENPISRRYLSHGQDFFGKCNFENISIERILKLPFFLNDALFFQRQNEQGVADRRLPGQLGPEAGRGHQAQLFN